MKQVLFTDLDGTMLDLYDYSFDAALPALEALKHRNIPVVFCTAKTLVENEYYRKELGIDDPFIVENGGAIFVPENYFSFSFECKKRGDYCVVEFGALYGELRAALRAIKEETGFKITGFGDMTAEEVAADANLSVEMAKLAKQKEYNESFIFDEPESEAAVLFDKINEKGFAATHGGRYYNIHGKNADKGKAVRALTELFKREYGEVKTFGVGDSMNDISMLNAVEQPAVVKNKKGAWLDISLPGLYKAKGEGPVGWAEVVEKLLKQENLLDNEVELVGKLLERIESEKGQGKGKLNMRVLDVGCGTGRLSIYLNEKAGCDVTGIDMLQKKIEKAKTRCSGSGNVEFEMQSAEEMGFRDDVFDVVVSLKALHEIPDPKGALKESNRVLNARRGRILIIDWVGGTAKTSTHAHAPKYFTPAGLEQMLSESGFVNTRVELNREGELMLAEGRKKSQEKIIFDNRTQMNADNQDFKFSFGTKLEVKRKVFDNLWK